MLSTAELVARIRIATGDTQEALARRLGVSFPTVNAWERGRSEPRANHRRQLEAVADEHGVFHGVTVLVVDDDPVTGELVTAAAAEVDHSITVDTASNGWEGLIKVGSLKPSLLLLDIMMPGLDGIEVARRLPEIDGLDHMNLSFVTASHEPGLLERARSLGAGVVLKPFDIDEMADLLRGHLASLR